MSESRQTLSPVNGWVAIVPMRAGSKGLPSKNVRQLAGAPLYQHSVNAAREAGASKIVISTDIESVLHGRHHDDVTVIGRPAELAQDGTPMSRVVLHVLSEKVGLRISDSTMVVLLQPTSPLRTSEDIRASIQRVATSDVDLAMGVTEVDAGVLKFGRVMDGRFIPISDPEHCFANRQTLPPVVRPNGAVYAFQAGWFRQNGGFVTSRIAAIAMPPERSIDVDTIQDFERVERIFSKKREGAA